MPEWTMAGRGGQQSVGCATVVIETVRPPVWRITVTYPRGMVIFLGEWPGEAAAKLVMANIVQSPNALREWILQQMDAQ